MDSQAATLAENLNDELQNIYENIVVLESYIIDALYKGLRNNGHSDIPFHSEKPVTKIETNMVNFIAYCRRAEYFINKKRDVYAVYEGYFDGLPEKNKSKITSIDQLESIKKTALKFGNYKIGFIVSPRDDSSW